MNIKIPARWYQLSKYLLVPTICYKFYPWVPASTCIFVIPLKEAKEENVIQIVIDNVANYKVAKELLMQKR